MNTESWHSSFVGAESAPERSDMNRMIMKTVCMILLHLLGSKSKNQLTILLVVRRFHLACIVAKKGRK